MKNIVIDAYVVKEHVPSVNFDANSGVCELSGESFPEHSVEFYEPLIAWLKEYFVEKNKPLIFNFKLTYYNTSSSKRIFEILCHLKEYEDAGGNVKVNWYFDEDDSEMMIEVEDLMIASKMKINQIIIEEEDSDL